MFYKTDAITYQAVYPGFWYTNDYEKQLIGYREKSFGN